MMSSGLSLVRLQIFGRQPLLYTSDIEVDGRVANERRFKKCTMTFVGLGDLKNDRG